MNMHPIDNLNIANEITENVWLLTGSYICFILLRTTAIILADTTIEIKIIT